MLNKIRFDIFFPKAPKSPKHLLLGEYCHFIWAGIFK